MSRGLGSEQRWALAYLRQALADSDAWHAANPKPTTDEPYGTPAWFACAEETKAWGHARPGVGFTVAALASERNPGATDTDRRKMQRALTGLVVRGLVTRSSRWQSGHYYFAAREAAP